MKKQIKNALVIALTLGSSTLFANTLPDGFVYLKDVAPSIIQDIRYATDHNFVGKPIKGYETNQCILTKQAADQLVKIQTELLESNLSLKVYDCYRPTSSVKEFLEWSKSNKPEPTKAEFYPNIARKDLFAKKYIAEKSGHCRGSTVDLTIVQLPAKKQAIYKAGQPLVACTAPYLKRFEDNSIDMGTGYDCLDINSRTTSQKVNLVARFHRAMLNSIMEKYGFSSTGREWWHYTLDKEPFPKKSFDFPVA